MKINSLSVIKKTNFFIRFKKPDGIRVTKRTLRIVGCGVALAVLMTSAATPVFASGNVSGAIESTWNAAQSQIKQVVNNVVFPVIDMILAILFFVKVATAYLDYRKHGQFDFTAPAILFACLLFSLTAPMYIWSVL